MFKQRLSFIAVSDNRLWLFTHRLQYSVCQNTRTTFRTARNSFADLFRSYWKKRNKQALTCVFTALIYGFCLKTLNWVSYLLNSCIFSSTALASASPFSDTSLIFCLPSSNTGSFAKFASANEFICTNNISFSDSRLLNCGNRK